MRSPTRRFQLLAAAVGGLALVLGTPTIASSLPVGPPPIPGIVPTPTPPPLPLPLPLPPPHPAGQPAPIYGVLDLPPVAGAPGSGSVAVGPLPDGAAALTALGDPAASAQGGDPVAAGIQRLGPNDNLGSRPAETFDRQQYVISAEMDALNASLDAIQAVHAGGGSGRFGWPEQYRTISQPFGCTSLRLAPTSSMCPSGHFHTGDDVAGPDQTGVFAADTGVIRIVHGSTGYGNYAIVTHGNGYSTLYGHLHDFAVKDGDLVNRGDLIAHEGTTGNSTGPHLHFEVRMDHGYLDPCPFLEGCGKSP